MIACTAAALYTPLERIERALVLIDDGVILEITSRPGQAVPSKARIVDFGDAVLAPGFIDIHIHGGAGHDVMESDPGALPCVEAFLLKHGVTTYFPTTVTAPLDATLAALDRLADAIEDKTNGNSPRARPLGIHLEGPFISHARRGVHPPEYLLKPTLSLFERFWQASRAHIKVMTIAPELQGAQEVIQEASKRGVCVSLGHSDADLGAARSAMAAGARHATHTFNAMRPLGHRDPGILGLVLTDANMTADIIADGIHVDPAVVELFVKLKGPERAVLITDATSAAGMPDGHYRLGSFELEVRNGKCILGDKLAGSVLTMDRAIRNVIKFANLDLQQALRTASLNPANVVGISGRHGVLAPGADADIVVLNPQNEVVKTIVRGAGI
ncbi:MAG TPA: N-acetylglucosamine-6-phosphate deacetylase [Terriglobales bacterium]|nr:N-acetylglucosamine-6-phosphate deacetylase [Terriglobales bacterium]